MRYFLDTEFHERGPSYPITLISLALVSEDDREFYVENDDTGPAEWNDWLRANVAPHLTGPKMAYWSIAPAILKFIGNDTSPEFWAYFADYDWVLFCQLFGSMMELPVTFPQFCLDLKQEMYLHGIPKPLIVLPGAEHNALRDARWNKALYGHIQRKKAS